MRDATSAAAAPGGVPGHGGPAPISHAPLVSTREPRRRAVDSGICNQDALAHRQPNASLPRIAAPCADGRLTSSALYSAGPTTTSRRLACARQAALSWVAAAAWIGALAAHSMRARRGWSGWVAVVAQVLDGARFHSGGQPAGDASLFGRTQWPAVPRSEQPGLPSAGICARPCVSPNALAEQAPPSAISCLPAPHRPALAACPALLPPVILPPPPRSIALQLPHHPAALPSGPLPHGQLVAISWPAAAAAAPSYSRFV